MALQRERGRLYSALTERLLLNAVRMDSGKPTVIRPPPRPLTRLCGCNGILPFSFRLFCFCRLGPLSFVLKPLPAVAFTAFHACIATFNAALEGACGNASGASQQINRFRLGAKPWPLRLPASRNNYRSDAIAA